MFLFNDTKRSTHTTCSTIKEYNICIYLFIFFFGSIIIIPYSLKINKEIWTLITEFNKRSQLKKKKKN